MGGCFLYVYNIALRIGKFKSVMKFRFDFNFPEFEEIEMRKVKLKITDGKCRSGYLKKGKIMHCKMELS